MPTNVREGLLKVKHGENYVTVYPKTTVDNVEGLSDQLEALEGAAEAGEKADRALNILKQLGDIAVAPIDPPTLIAGSNYTYDGTEQYPEFDGFDVQKMVKSGDTSATNAGNYTCTITPSSTLIKWTDTKDSAPRAFNWSIAKIAPTNSLSDSSSFSLSSSKLTHTITVTSNTGGAITASSSNDTIATVSVSGNTVTITAGSSDGNVTITINISGGTNYTDQTFTVSGSYVALPPLSQATPSQIQYAAQNDLARSNWSIGDTTQEITLNGSWTTVGTTISLSNFKAKATLIGINHNSAKEGNHLLHFLLNRNSDGVQIGFHYSQMNTSGTNSGGWNGSAMKKTTIANFQNSILPSEWRNVLKSCTKYTDNTGGGSNTASYVTATSEKVFLLSEYEVHGSRSYANSAEQNQQLQYEYFKNGNSKVHYRHDNPTNATSWWLRSVYATNSNWFCRVDGSGGADCNNAGGNYRVVPALTIG